MSMWIDYGYLFQSGIILAVLCAVYWLLLRREEYFHANRYILISIVLLPLMLPILPLPQALVNWTGELIGNGSPTPVDNPATILDLETPLQGAPATGEGNAASTMEGSAHTGGINFSEIFTVIYLLGALFMLLRFVWSLASLSYLLHTSTRQGKGAYVLVTPRAEVAPFSFFHFIVLDRRRYDASTYNQILRHEQIHADQWHTVDILLAEALLIVQWFNPFAWLLRDLIDSNLEYGVDDQLLREGNDRKVYQYSLLNVASKTASNAAFGTNYNLSQLKNRIAMMNRKKSPGFTFWKYLALLLALMGIVIFTACQKEASPAVPNGGGDHLFVVVTQDATPADLKMLESRAGELGYDLEVDEEQFSEEGKLSRVVVNMNFGQSSGSVSSVSAGPSGMRPVFIHRNQNTGESSFSNLGEKEVHLMRQNLHNATFLIAGGQAKEEFFELQEALLPIFKKEAGALKLKKIQENNGRLEPLAAVTGYRPHSRVVQDIRKGIEETGVSENEVIYKIDGQVADVRLEAIDLSQVDKINVIEEKTPVYDLANGSFIRYENITVTVDVRTKK